MKRALDVLLSLAALILLSAAPLVYPKIPPLVDLLR